MSLYATPRRFGYERPPGIADEPPTWETMVTETCAKISSPRRREAYLRGVWQSLEPVAGKDGQFVLPLSKGLGELRERQALVKALLAEGLAQSGA